MPIYTLKISVVGYLIGDVYKALCMLFHHLFQFHPHSTV